jgi:hypothetical protein
VLFISFPSYTCSILKIQSRRLEEKGTDFGMARELREYWTAVRRWFDTPEMLQLVQLYCGPW